MEYRIALEKSKTFEKRATPVSQRASGSGRLRLAVVCDLREENWPSMNLVADMLLAGLRANHADTIAPTRVRPPMRRRFTRSTEDMSRAGARLNTDRLLNRFWDYPCHLRRRRGEFDLFHIVDHSYAQLVRQLPPERTIVTCHDTDTFRCLLEPSSEPRPAPFRMMTKRVLDGFRRAARIACDSRATRDELLAHHLVAPERVVVIPNGVHPAFTPEGEATAERAAVKLLGERDDEVIELLHVGSTIERKRIDMLLETFASVRRKFPRARLVRAGGAFTPVQEAHAARLGVRASISVLPFISTEVLAAVYRRAALVLQPSEREGFGLPLVEALACGTPVVASRLPVLREVGGDEAVTYCAAGETTAWNESVVDLLCERADDSASWERRRAAGVRRAALFTWDEYVAKTVALYGEVLASCG